MRFSAPGTFRARTSPSLDHACDVFASEYPLATKSYGAELRLGRGGQISRVSGDNSMYTTTPDLDRSLETFGKFELD